MTELRTMKFRRRGGSDVSHWFILASMVVVFIGLAAVAHFAVQHASGKNREQTRAATAHALKGMIREWSRGSENGESTPAGPPNYSSLLNEARIAFSADFIRIVDTSGRILASTRVMEVGAQRSASERTSHDIRLPIPGEPSASNPTVAGVDPTAEGIPVRFLEAGWDTYATPVELLGQTPILLIAIGTPGLLGILFVGLRRRLRGAFRVADRLESNADRIESELASLRIGDTLDGVTTAWNRLIELAQQWSQAVQRSEANAELAKVLQHAASDTLSQAVNVIPDGIVLITREVRFEYVNSTACRLLGWSAEAARKVTLPEARSEGVGQHMLEVLRGAQRADGSFDPRSEMLDLSQSPQADAGCYRMYVYPLPRGQAEGSCILLVRDVSQQVRSDKAREDFIAQVTHELRTPLTNIRAYTETLASGMFDDPKVINDCYNVITKETRRLSRLIEDILNVSQLEVGSIELHVAAVDLKALLTEAVRDVRGLADEKNLDVQVVLPAKLESIRGDRDKLAVVLNNLLGNAIKYTPKGGNVIVGCQLSSDAVMITVKDNGIGIEPADQSKIFEKFQRGSNPAALAESGTGIGLYTAREIVRRHGGEIEIMSEKGMGSTFMVRLPHQAGRAMALTTSQGNGT